MDILLQRRHVCNEILRARAMFKHSTDQVLLVAVVVGIIITTQDVYKREFHRALHARLIHLAHGDEPHQRPLLQHQQLLRMECIPLDVPLINE